MFLNLVVDSFKVESESNVFYHYGDEQDISSIPVCLQHLKTPEFLFLSMKNFKEQLHRLSHQVMKSSAKNGSRYSKGESSKGDESLNDEPYILNEFEETLPMWFSSESLL